jgi:Family of unknown function (DUF6510)
MSAKGQQQTHAVQQEIVIRSLRLCWRSTARRDRAAEITCDGCGAVAAVGAIRVYGTAMGAVFRCTHCDTVVLRLTHTPAGLFLDMRGARRLFVASPEL